MKNFLGALLLAFKNFLKTVIVRAAGASGLEKYREVVSLKFPGNTAGTLPGKNGEVSFDDVSSLKALRILLY